MRTLKYLVSFVLLLSLFSNLPLISAGAVTEAESSNSFDKHEYHEGVVDGALYNLRCVGNNQYLTVNNAGTSIFTTLSTAALTNATHQQFRMEYMGSNLYRIVPRHTEGTTDRNAVDGRMYLSAEWYDSGELVSVYPISDFWGCYRLERISEDKYVIYTEASDFTCALTIDTANSNRLIHKTYSSMSEAEKQYAQWTFNSANAIEYDSYSKYYIRNGYQRVYLDVSGISTYLIKAAPFNGTEAQQWKQTSTDVSGGYYLSSMNDLFDYICIMDGSVRLGKKKPTSGDNSQLLELEYMGDMTNGAPTFNIAITVNGEKKYLNLGNFVEGSTDTYEIVYENDPVANDYWVFEEALHDYHDIQALTLNTTFTHTKTSLGEVPIWMLPPDSSVTYGLKYKITLTSTAPVYMNIYTGINNDDPAHQYTLDPTYGHYVKDVIVEPNKPCYIFVKSLNNEAFTYQIKAEPYVVVYHSYDQFEAIYWDVIPPSQDMGWRYENYTYMTVERAERETNELGDRHFNSYVFIYYGHGGPGYALYQNYNNIDEEANVLWADELPDMSKCQLAIWSACNSAAWDQYGDSMLTKSLENGAKCVIGWHGSPIFEDSEKFLNSLMQKIANGSSILWAINAAIDTTQNTYEKVETIIDSLAVGGDMQQVLHPQYYEDDDLYTMSVAATTNAFNRSEYTLTAENESIGAKLYSKLLNGIPTDDYFVEFYHDGVLQCVKKSAYTLTDSEMQILSAQASAVLSNRANLNAEDLSYTFVDGEWHLMEAREVVVMHGDHACTQVQYVDLTTTGGELYS